MSFTNLPKLKYVEIDSTDVSTYVIDFEVEQIFDKTLRRCEIEFKKTLSSAIDYDDGTLTGKEIIIKRGVSTSTEQILFRGYIRVTTFEGGYVKCVCEDKLSETKYVTVNTRYDINVDTEAGVISEIFKNLLDERTTLTADSSSVQNSGSVDVLDRFILHHRNLYDALNELAYAINWQFYYNPTDDKVYFEPQGYQTSGTSLVTGTNIVNLPRWDIDSSKLFNQIIVKGSPQEVNTQEGPTQLAASGDFNTTSITLDNKPLIVKVFCDTSNPPTTEKVAGIENSTGTFDYSVNQEQSLITWSSTFSPTTSYYAIVQYTYNIPVQVKKKNQSSIDTYSDGFPKAVSQFRKDIKTVEDAERWADKQLAIYSEPFYATELQVVSLTDLTPGNLYTVQDNIQNINKTLMVKKIKYSYPYNYDVVEVGDQAYRISNWGVEIAPRLKRLEEEQADNEDLLLEVVDFNGNVTYEPRYFEGFKKTLVGGFYLGNKPFATLGTDVLGVSSGSEVSQMLIQANNIYKEYLYDDDFYDSSSSSGTTWNTIIKTITTTGDCYTNKIAHGQSYSYYTLSFASISGSYTVEISGDGGTTYQTAVEGTRTAISTSTSDGVILKITASSGTVTLQNTTYTNGNYNQPAIKLILEE